MSCKALLRPVLYGTMDSTIQRIYSGWYEGRPDAAEASAYEVAAVLSSGTALALLSCKTTTALTGLTAVVAVNLAANSGLSALSPLSTIVGLACSPVRTLHASLSLGAVSRLSSRNLNRHRR